MSARAIVQTASGKTESRWGPLIDFAELVSTGPFGSMLHKSDYVSDGVPLINPTNITDEAIVPDLEKQVGAEALARLASYVLKAGDVVVGRRGEIGRCAVVGEAEAGWVCGTGCFFIRPRQSLDSRFLAQLLRSPKYRVQLERSSTGATMKNMSNTALAQLPIVVPPLAEQHRIVALLDEAFEGIATAKANAEKNLRSAEDFSNVGYQAIVKGFDSSNWPTIKVADLAAVHKGAMRTGPFGSQLLHSEFVGEGIAVLGIDNAVANEFRWDRRRYITPEKFRQLARYRVLPGDVLITIMGTCGRCAVVPDDIPLAINTKHLCCITLDRGKCLPEFLHGYFLHDPRARHYLGAQAKGSIMADLNMGIISELPVVLPSLQQQTEIADRFNELQAECSRLAGIQMQKLSALDELKRSLLHQAFIGALTSKSLDMQLAEVA